MSILLIVGLGFFIRTMYYKIRLLAALEPSERLDHIKERLKNMLIFAFGQKRLVGRKKERSSGLMHALIFWGFCILLIRSITLYGHGFVEGFTLPLLGEDFFTGYLYIALKDIMEGLVLLMVIYAIIRRAIIKPERLHNSWEAYFILILIGILMLSDLFYDGARYNLIELHNNPENIHFLKNPVYGSEFLWAPVSVGAANIISWLSAKTTLYIMIFTFWLHVITQLVFLNILPLGKHFHVITAIPNVFLKSLGYPHDKPKLLDLEDEEAWENESLGINYIYQLNWKQGLDLFTCTECGRCKEVCPTYVTDKPLNMNDFNNDLKYELKENQNKIIKRADFHSFKKHENDTEQLVEENNENSEINNFNHLIGDVIQYDTLWACTTCRACEEVCPVTIEHVPRIISMRQAQMLMQESYPKELNIALKGLERNGNPWGIGYDKRADWAEGLDVKLMADDPNVDYLLWVGCAGSFDDRTKKVSTSLVKILQKAGISFAILGTEEKCTGDFARRVGNEMLFQMMAQDNIETLNNYGVKNIITACPHCLNTIKHEYPQLGGNYNVYHHTEFIDYLLKEGKLSLKKSFDGMLSFHDPCYLGRYNSIYDQPRNILQSISSSELKELVRTRQESFCCGAGGGRMWMEENIGKRINLERSEEVVNHDVDNIAVGCPFCLTMIEDGMKEMNKEDEIKTKDIAEIVANHMD